MRTPSKTVRRRIALREMKKIKLVWPGLNYSTAKGVLDPLTLEAPTIALRSDQRTASELTSESPFQGPQAYASETPLRAGDVFSPGSSFHH